MRRSVLATVKSAAVIVGGTLLVCTAVADTATPLARPITPSYSSQALGVLPGDIWSEGYGVNDAGSVVGASFPAFPGGINTRGRAFYWDRADPGVLYQLTTSGANGRANAIAGGHGATAYAVGHELSPSESLGSRHAVIWIAPPTSGPIALDGQESEAYGVNDSGIAVGSRTDVASHLNIPTIWSPNGTNDYVRTDIALLPNHEAGVAFDINNDGIVVGLSVDHAVGGPVARAFLRLLNGSVHELAPAQGDTWSQAEAVSDVFTNSGDRFVYVAGVSIGVGVRGVRWTVNVDTGAVVDDPTVLSLRPPTGVNGAGDISGSNLQGAGSATLWQGGSYITLKPPKGGHGGGSSGLARTASSPRYVVGWTYMGGQGSRAVVWDVD